MSWPPTCTLDVGQTREFFFRLVAAAEATNKEWVPQDSNSDHPWGIMYLRKICKLLWWLVHCTSTSKPINKWLIKIHKVILECISNDGRQLSFLQTVGGSRCMLQWHWSIFITSIFMLSSITCTGVSASPSSEEVCSEQQASTSRQVQGSHDGDAWTQSHTLS